MSIPVYIVTGFIDSGKTTLIKRILNTKESREYKILLVQFELGEEEFTSRYNNCEIMTFSKKAYDSNLENIAEKLAAHLDNNEIDEIWFEWNGVTLLSEVYELLSYSHLHKKCEVLKVVHMADGNTLEHLVGKTGGALPEQISNCDFTVTRNVNTNKSFLKIRRLLRSINPGVNVYDSIDFDKIYKKIYKKKSYPINNLCKCILAIVFTYLLVRLLFDFSKLPIDLFTNIFIGIMLQGIPFLLIGVIISSVIQIFISNEAIERKFPKNTALGMIYAIFAAFCIPVCDCASIPIFRSLVKKGVPMSVAVTFMTATPVVNPVVMLSTYYAFSGSIKVVMVRVVLGVICAILIGLFFSPKTLTPQAYYESYDGVMCNCGCYDGLASVTNIKGKMIVFARHTQAEFFNVGKYFLIGAFVSAIFQTMEKNFVPQGDLGLFMSLFVMMMAAFFLSLCSSSDAVIGRSFATIFPFGAVMGFLVFGPMMDVKNAIMLSSSFSKAFIAKLFVITFVVCFTVVYFFSILGRYIT